MKLNGTIKLFADAHVFDNEYQGSRTFIKELYNCLLKKNDLQLYIAAYDIDNLKQYFPQAANIVFLKYKYRNSVARLLFDIPMLIKKHQIDYAHFQYITPVTKNCRFIVTTHDVLFNDFPGEFSFLFRKTKNYLYRAAARKADILTTVSAFSKNAIQRYFSIPPQNITVLPHGVNTVFFEPNHKEQAKEYILRQYGIEKCILFVSRFEPRKNHLVLLKAFLDLELFAQGYHLVFIGHKSMETPAVDLLLNNLPENIRKYILLVDKITDEELCRFYKAASVFVYPSKAEGFGMPPLEAGALQIPVLCSNATALGDFTFFGDNLIDISNYNHFKQKLSGIINGNTSNNALSTIAATIQQNYCWQKTADQFYQLLKQNSMS